MTASLWAWCQWCRILAHPRLYWARTGVVGTPYRRSAALPVLTGQTGWGRSPHFLSAWIAVITGLAYVVSGLFADTSGPACTRGCRALAARLKAVSNHLSVLRPTDEPLHGYNVLQQLTYLFVVFALFPSMVWTGLAMSPAITSVAPVVSAWLGGQQSARTLHFAGASALVCFLFVHVAMVWRAGFTTRVGAMITGGLPATSGITPIERQARRRPLQLVSGRTRASSRRRFDWLIARLDSTDHGGLYGA
jgi:thiosulfate reductase cytochrome b subunit